MNGTSASATAYRYIARQPGVRSGNAIIEGTRIGVHDVIGLLQNGETVESIVTRCFPNITRAQVYECLAYYEDHRGEIDVLVARQMAAPAP
ncbi:MAG: DUF433 domain-containing protein [Limisphaerales bacterium]|jgi:uncharacterized protein (DUF433 family)